MGYIQKGNAQLVFQADQLILHILAQLQIKGSQRLVQKKDFWLIYDCPGNGDPLLLSSA